MTPDPAEAEALAEHTRFFVPAHLGVFRLVAPARLVRDLDF
ncbi:hypothetical protein ACXVUM_00800 [Williamsia sp. SKLECPSW1]